jgi:Leucine-rich repeat (LRR) protein
MSVKLLLKGILFLQIVYLALAQINPSCKYYFTELSEYSCNLTISNPNGYDDYIRIDGIHLPGYDDSKVKIVKTTEGSITTNIPKIICAKYGNLLRFDASYSHVQEVSSVAFLNCKSLVNIELQGNNISRIGHDAFINNPMVTWLDLQINSISELPENIFRPLTELFSISLYNNRIQVVHANWFGDHSKALLLGFAMNRIESIDPRIIYSFPRVTTILLTENICANGIFSSWSSLQQCFENYERLGK